MGLSLIDALKGAAKGVLADSWREYFYCDSLPDSVLMVKGKKRTTGHTTNKKGEDNIISNGSIIAVNEGQCMLIVEQGAIVDICAEAGEFLYDKSTEPSIFYGSLGTSIKETFKTIGKRFTFGGDTAKDQRVYYINIKEIKGNKYGTAQPISFRLVDSNSGIDWDIPLRCNGLYSYKIANPLVFYKEIAGNVTEEYNRSGLTEPMREEIVDELANVFGDLSMQSVRYGNINSYKDDVVAEVKVRLNERWGENRGIELSEITLNPTISDADRERINEMQRLQTMTDPSRLRASYVLSHAEAMKSAAENKNGAMMGFMGMNMANQTGTNNMQGLFGTEQAQDMFGMGQQGQPGAAGFAAGAGIAGAGFAAGASMAGAAAPVEGEWICACGAKNTGKFCVECGAGKPKPESADEWICTCGTKNTGKFCVECGAGKPKPEPADEWTCTCGTKNTGKFCVECGTKRPEPDTASVWTCTCGTKNTGKFCIECGASKPEAGWTCSCGAVNKGKFCTECGAGKPVGAPLYRCDKCGWEPEDPMNPPKFCPECADPFNEDDIKK